MIVTIKEVTQEFTTKGAEYKKVMGYDGTGKQVTKNVFDNLSSKWPLLQEEKTLEFVMEKKGQFWNVTDIKEMGTLPPQEPKPMVGNALVQEAVKQGGVVEKVTDKPLSGQEHGMLIKELGENIRGGQLTKDNIMGIKSDQASFLYKYYWNEIYKRIKQYTGE